MESWGNGPVTFLFVPTIYFRTVSELRRLNPKYVEYLEGLSEMPAEVPILWVGPGMPYSTEITLEQSAELSAVLGRKVLIWDNYPATDNFFLFEPFCGPYRGRDPDLPQAVTGILSNPMNYPNLSKIPLCTVARYLADPAAYDPQEGFEEAVVAAGGSEARAPLRTFALQFYGHPIIPPTDCESPEFLSLLQPFWQEYAGPAYPGPYAAALRDQFAAFSGLWEELCASVPDPAFRAELREPAQKLGLYGEAGLAAMDILDLLHRGEIEGVRPLLDRLVSGLTAARALPWRPGENYLHWIGAILFESPPVEVDVIRKFLRRVRAMAEEAVGGG
jgi:hyaluronoglucosaminidase